MRRFGHDHAEPGAYFVTICAQGRACLFGDIVAGEMRLNEAGRMVQAVWEELPQHYLGVQPDAFVVMPNHVHGIIVLSEDGGTDITAVDDVGAGPCARPQDVTTRSSVTGQPQGVAPTLSLPDVVHRFKSLTTRRYADGVKQHGWTPFEGRLWRRSYYDRVIRDEDELERIRSYIAENPARWEEDEENPNALGAR